MDPIVIAFFSAAAIVIVYWHVRFNDNAKYQRLSRRGAKSIQRHDFPDALFHYAELEKLALRQNDSATANVFHFVAAEGTGIASYCLEDFPEAIVAFQRALEVAGKGVEASVASHVQILCLLASSYQSLSRADESRQSFEQLKAYCQSLAAEEFSETFDFLDHAVAMIAGAQQYELAMSILELLDQQLDRLPNNEVHQQRLQCQIRLANFLYAKDEFQTCLGKSESILNDESTNPPLLAAAFQLVGSCQFAFGDFARATQSQQSSLEQIASYANASEIAHSKYTLATYLLYYGNYQQATKLAQRCHPTLKREYQFSDEGRRFLLLSDLPFLFHSGDYKSMSQVLNELESIPKTLGVRALTNEASNQCWRAQFFGDLQCFDRAIACIREALDSLSRMHGDSRHDSIVYRILLTSFAIHLGQLDEAGEQLALIAATQKSLGSQNYSWSTSLLSVRASFELAQGKASECLSTVESAIERLNETVLPNNTSYAEQWLIRSQAQHAIGDIESAINSAKRSISKREESQPPDHLRFFASYQTLATLYQQLGQNEHAIEFEQKADAIRKQCDLILQDATIGTGERELNPYAV
ncbi:tetratricopeptide repeat protein [Rhodopirellula sp. MGV]|uniref:tetratricopeptide repeat protein n=1 Tax=Rhodopirellula sp. MGV TaxID=2023130 RepID=UPI000CD393DB|nr:tetratricopeptide repeat protein [Rhodopirellula sp. MGV]PNY36147.1 hypothetical protein C2E31_14540 [Rhodopirellula baltica]